MDFPVETLTPLNIEALHPDDLVMELLGVAPALVVGVLHEQAGALRMPPMDVRDLLANLEASGLIRSMAEVRRLTGGDG